MPLYHCNRPQALAMITLKNLTAAPPLLQRICSSTYNNVMPILDAALEMKFSYLMPCTGSPATNKGMKFPLDLHVDYIAFSDTRLARTCKETETCQVLSSVYRLTYVGWPATCRQAPRVVHTYWGMHDELTCNDSLQMKGSGNIIFLALRECFLHDLHRTCWQHQILVHDKNYHLLA